MRLCFESGLKKEEEDEEKNNTINFACENVKTQLCLGFPRQLPGRIKSLLVITGAKQFFD